MYQQQRLADAGHGEFVEATRSKWTNMRKMKARAKDIVLLMRSNRKMANIETALGDEPRLVQVVWSMWDGYWADDQHVRPFCAKYGIERTYVHTSGHASWSDLKRLIEGLKPVTVVPIHTEHAGVFAQNFNNVILPSEDVRQFAMGRMARAVLTDQHFTMPAGFDPEKLLEGTFARYAGDGEIQTVRILFDKEVAGWIEEREWQPQQKLTRRKNGDIELEFPAKGLFEVQRWVLSWGRCAKVLGPAELAEAVRKEIQAMAAGIEGGSPSMRA